MTEPYRTIEVTPLSPSVGAEISGVDLSSGVSQETFAEIHRAFLEHLVIFFRGQALDVASFKAFAERFGPLFEDPIVKAKEGEPKILTVVKEAQEKRAFGESWHSDSTFWEKPPMASLLYAVDLPPLGGDTMFANQYLAYETLSAGLKAVIDGLKAVHRTDGYRAAYLGGGYKDRSMQLREDDVIKAHINDQNAHPVVRTHPETGRKALYVNRSYAKYFEGWTEEESRPLLDTLIAHSTRPEFTSRYRWSSGSLAIWDNRCALHHPVNDYTGHRREMMRIVIEGDRPA